MLFGMLWQDFIFSIGGFAFFLALLPSILSDEKPAFWTSFMTAAFLSLFVYTFTTLELWLSAVGQGLVALGWWTLTVQSYMKQRHQAVATPPDTTTPTKPIQ